MRVCGLIQFCSDLAHCNPGNVVVWEYRRSVFQREEGMSHSLWAKVMLTATILCVHMV